MTDTWDSAYTAAGPAPWDIGRPQPEFARLAEAGLFTGRFLDAGCGTGEQTLLAAAHGADALGVDVAPAAIEQARAKAAERASSARFQVADALALRSLGESFDVILDSGLFHVFSDADRPRYVASLASVLTADGTCYLMCFSDRQPGDFGPRRVRQDELRDAFSDGWRIAAIDAAHFEINPMGPFTSAQAWLATIVRS